MDNNLTGAEAVKFRQVVVDYLADIVTRTTANDVANADAALRISCGQ